MIPQRPTRQGQSRTSGFTLAEIILVVAVMAILVSLSTPPIVEFLKRRDIQNEVNMQNDIVKAMKSYLTDRTTLPAVTALDTCASGSTQPTWASELARYSNLSARQISCDVWNRPRVYAMFTRAEAFLGSTINVYYASLHSSGPDLSADGASATAGGAADSTPGIHTSGKNFSAPTAGTTWWHRITGDDNKLNAFVGMQPAMDDQLIRFTDYPDKVEKYKVSLERLERIAQALESYSKTKYNEAVVACNGVCANPPEDFIFYPPSSQGYVQANYHSTVRSETSTANGGTATISAATNNVTRKTQMRNLMRLLGLPDEYCCNALATFAPTAGAKPEEVPFYYFSNPRPRTSSGCGTRPDPATGRTLPARLSVDDGTAACG